MSKIAILTAFQEFNPGYSLTGIVQDQARMLLSYGHEVHVFVSDKYQSDVLVLPETDFDRYGLPKENFFVHNEVPFSDLTDYRKREDISEDHKVLAQNFANFITSNLHDFDFIFTHDFVFTGWFMPYGLGCKLAGRSENLKHVRWFHWIHSIPTHSLNWWRIGEYGPKHKIVYPNKSDADLVAAQYNTVLDRICVIPHIKDPRSWWEFDSMTCSFLKDFPSFMQADIIQVYPASTDRLLAKRIKEVILIFARLKAMGFKVFLCIANQWATKRQQKEDIESYIRVARRNKLLNGDDLVFTSEWKEAVNCGIPRRMLRELMLLSNVFIFPTREESFGLVAPEAGLSGVLPIWNKSLNMQMEVNGFNGLYLSFGSFQNHFEPESWGTYLEGAASILVDRFRLNESIMLKTWHRKQYNWDTLYHKYYLPSFEGSKIWG